jgi:hypothetical protein
LIICRKVGKQWLYTFIRGRYGEITHLVRNQEEIAWERDTIAFTPKEPGEVWQLIEHYIEIGKKSMEIAEHALASLKAKSMVIQNYSLGYLLEDEKKHDNLLNALDSIKRIMYPYV